MLRWIMLLVLGVTAIAAFDTANVLAGSSKNPYSSFNISGINYGSQQWEREHGGKGSSSHSSGRVRWRRR